MSKANLISSLKCCSTPTQKPSYLESLVLLDMKFLNITAANYLTGSGLLYSVNSFVNDNMNFLGS